MPSSRAWQCPKCGTTLPDLAVFSQDNGDHWGTDGHGICLGVPVEVVVTPLTETRKGWLYGATDADPSWTVLDQARFHGNSAVPVLVVPMPEEAGNA